VPSAEDPSVMIEKVHLYKFYKNADVNFFCIATEPEMKYCNDNKAIIIKSRKKSLQKDIDLCRSDISMLPNGAIEVPVPGHKHCGICRMNYEEFDEHIESKEH
jgi:hypothetical protein